MSMKSIINIPKDVELPLIGCIAFGCIDRGTNLIQVRATTLCPLNCVFCSTDAGKFSKTRITDYIVEPDYLIDCVRELVRFKKDNDLEMHLDSVGEPTTHPKFVDLVQMLSEIEEVKVISMQTNGTLLTEEMIDELVETGLSRINLSINALDPKIAQELSGCKWYNINRIKEIAKYIVQCNIELLISPVWIPGVNDSEMIKLIEFAKKIIKDKPVRLGIQKYEIHKYGRKIEGIRAVSWWRFYKQLEKWENQFDCKLKLGPYSFNIHKSRILPYTYKKNERISVEVMAPGWIKREMIGVERNRCITIIDCDARIGDDINVRILRNKHNLYIARRE